MNVRAKPLTQLFKTRIRCRIGNLKDLHCARLLVAATASPQAAYFAQQVRKNSSAKPASRRKQVKDPVAEEDNFGQVASDALKQIRKAITPLIELNDGFGFEITAPEDNSTDVMTFNVGNRGSYIFRIDRSQKTLVVQSPVSGIFSYAYDYEQQLWLGTQDGHDMRGLITRDLLRHCRGCPMF